jgi:hypothetical protein
VDGWHWLSASVMAVVLVLLVLLRYATYRERRELTLRQATGKAALLTPIVPIGFVAVLFAPLWLGWILIAIPAAVLVVSLMTD